MRRAVPGRRRSRHRAWWNGGVLLLLLAIGLTACSEASDIIDVVEYVGTTGQVLEANGIEGTSAFDLDCDGSEEAKTVTCTGETSTGQIIESTGENFGEDNATLVVAVDGAVLYDGLLKDAPDS